VGDRSPPGLLNLRVWKQIGAVDYYDVIVSIIYITTSQHFLYHNKLLSRAVLAKLNIFRDEKTLAISP